MAFCESCGKQLGDGANFCRECGTAVNGTAQIPVQNQIQEVQSAADISLWKGFVAGWKKYAVCRDRARRKEYWGWVLFTCIFFVVFSFMDYWLDFENFGSLYGLFAIATIVPGITITVRRLHDTNRSGWQYFWLGFAPWIFFAIIIFFAVINLLVTGLFGFNSMLDISDWKYLISNMGFSVILLILTFFWGIAGGILLFAYCCLDSTLGENRFGPCPKNTIE